MGQKRVWNPVTARMFESFHAGSQRKRVNSLRRHGHLRQFCPDMPRLLHTDHLRNEAGRTAQCRTSASFTSAGSQTMHRCKITEHSSHIFCFSAHEHPLFWYEYLIKINQCLVIRILFAQINSFDISSYLKESLILRRSSQNVGDIWSVCRNRTGKSKIFIFRLHVCGRYNNNLMCKQNSSLITLKSADNNSVFPNLIDMNVIIPVRLFMRRQSTQPLHVGHRHRTAQIIFLYIINKIRKTFKIIGSQILIHIIGTRSQAGKSFRTGTAMCTTPYDLRQSTRSAGFPVGIFRRTQRRVIDTYLFSV